MSTTMLRDVASIQVGYQVRNSIQETAEGSHWIIQGKNFDSLHCLSADCLAKIFPERKPGRYLVEKGDILFMARGMEHFAYHVQEHLRDTVVSAAFYVIRVKSGNLLASYLAWWINQAEAQHYFRLCSGSGIMSFVSKNSLGQLQVKIPSLDVQKKIVETVSLRERERFLLERLRECRSRLINGVCAKAIEEDLNEC